MSKGDLFKRIYCERKLFNIIVMDNKSLINQLKLSYSPLCNRDFTVLRNDLMIQNAIECSSLYIIAQRPVIRFDNIRKNKEDLAIEFEIKQNNNPSVLKCKVPLFQKNITTNPEIGVDLYLGSNDDKTPLPKEFPVSNIHGMKILEVDPEDESKKTFLVWFTPEKFLQNYWNDLIIADIEGDIRDFTKYKVHYVGQATRQEIWKRLTGHEKLQDILSLENPFIFGDLPTHEIAILAFTFHENLHIRTFGDHATSKDFADAYLGKDLPEQRTIYLDAEKALINAMQPKYNNALFGNYPKSSDGLHKHDFNTISYSFVDPITLVYDKGEIRGGLSFWGGDSILIHKNETSELVKYSSSK